jgi:hypothetical protein
MIISKTNERAFNVQPLKYPLVFRTAELLVVSKTDLLPYLAFDASKAKTFYGFEGWTNFLFERIEALGLKHAGPWS